MKKVYAEKFGSGFAPVVILISVLIVVTLGFGAVLIYKNYMGNNRGLIKDEVPINYPSQSPIESPCGIPEGCPPEESGTTSWKTYTNTKYKYSIKYPSTCDVVNQVEQGDNTLPDDKLDNRTAGIIIQAPDAGDCSINIVSQETDETSEDLQKELSKQYIIENTTIAGINAFKYQINGESTIELINKGIFYRFTLIESKDNQILSTFKFLD